ncbi:MAG: hypothetical protein CMF22_10250 [Idiomarinaceae bacterium]|nr:hypothetical protein [Idiomarinaceae bacterium]MBG23823.1 hypothetical protein [Idiomarinaceae bacterium]|tara:strand:- start:34534 stop:35055 length:522 start_codon:yes stop_codon:yes gene_type:complete
MSVYVISDTHFGHENMLKYRPQFESMEEHDWVIAHNIMHVCGKKDTLYILGDVVLSSAGRPHLERIASHVEYLHIVLGNHDQERKGSPTLAEYNEVCKGVYGMKKYKSVWFTHAPIHPVELRGKYNVHGHVHDNSIDDPRYFNVSCEAIGYKPINMVDVIEQLKERNNDEGIR